MNAIATIIVTCMLMGILVGGILVLFHINEPE